MASFEALLEGQDVAWELKEALEERNIHFGVQWVMDDDVDDFYRKDSLQERY